MLDAELAYVRRLADDLESGALTTWRRGIKMIVEPASVTMVDKDVATVLTVGGIGTAEPVEYDKFQTFTLVRRDGRWQCAAFQNTATSDRAKRGNGAVSRLP